MNEDYNSNNCTPNPQYPYPAYQPKKNHTIPILILIACVAAAVIFAIRLLPSENSIDMSNYVTVTYSGDNGTGTVDVEFDYDYFCLSLLPDDVSTQLSGSLEAIDYASQTGDSSYDVVQSLQYTVEPDSGLSNGDTVTINFTMNEDALKQTHRKLKSTKLTYTVEGLLSEGEIDIFKNLHVTFTGIEPRGEASVQGDFHDDVLSNIEYVLDKDSGLSNGDTVTVSFSDESVNAIIAQTGRTPIATSKTFEVSGLEKLVTKLDQIDDETLAAMQSNAERVIQKYGIYDDYKKPEERLAGLEYVGSYLKYAKPDEKDLYPMSEYTMVYRLTYENSLGGSNSKFDYYMRAGYYNLSIDEEGQIDVDLDQIFWNSYNLRFDFSLDDPNGHGYSLEGYQTLQDVIDAITEKSDGYELVTDIK